MAAVDEPQVDSAAMLKILGEISAKLGEQTELLRSLKIGHGSLAEADGRDVTEVGPAENTVAETKTEIGKYSSHCTYTGRGRSSSTQESESWSRWHVLQPPASSVVLNVIEVFQT